MFFPARASAHASMIAVTPANGAVLQALPPTVTLTFDEEIDSMTISAAIRSGGITEQPGAEIAYLETQTTGYQKEVVFTLPADAPTDTTGNVVVHWRSIGLDGHQMEGYIPYSITTTAIPDAPQQAEVTQDTPQQIETPAPSSPDRDLLRALLRLVAFISASLVVGSLFFSRQSSLKALDNHIVPLLGEIKSVSLTLLSIATAFLAVLPVKSYITGPSMSMSGLVQTLSSAGVFLFGAVAIMSLVAKKRNELAVFIPALTALALVGVSHAASAKWAPAALLFGFLHQSALYLWAGPLLVLSVLYWRSPIVRHDKFSTLYLKPLQRFSHLASTMIALAVISGARQVIGILDGVPPISLANFGTWESLVILKTAVFLFFVAPIGMWHHTVFKRASQGLAEPPTIKSYILVESGALLAVAAIASVMSQTSV